MWVPGPLRNTGYPSQDIDTEGLYGRFILFLIGLAMTVIVLSTPIYDVLTGSRPRLPGVRAAYPLLFLSISWRRSSRLRYKYSEMDHSTIALKHMLIDMKIGAVFVLIVVLPFLPVSVVPYSHTGPTVLLFYALYKTFIGLFVSTQSEDSD